MLHQDEERDVSDSEHERFLEDTFVLPDDDDSDTEEDNMLELIDAACDDPRKSEEFSDDAMNFIANPKNSKSAKIYDRYQKQHVKHCKDDNARNEASQTTLANYFLW